MTRYGQPVRRRDRIEGQVLAFAHATREDADSYAAVNASQGLPTTVEKEDGGSWLTVVDLRPRISEIDSQFQESLK